jgi:hypothetical protein
MLKVALTLDERVEMVLLSDRQGWTQRQVANEFNDRHPERNTITHSAVEKLLKTFKETGSVVDKPRVGRPSVGEDIRTGVIAKFHVHSHWFKIFRTPVEYHNACYFIPDPAPMAFYKFPFVTDQ